jgi:hypothetical protein
MSVSFVVLLTVAERGVLEIVSGMESLADKFVDKKKYQAEKY